MFLLVIIKYKYYAYMNDCMCYDSTIDDAIEHDK